jgi:hypothetical protein
MLVNKLIAPSQDTRPAPRLAPREEMSKFLLWRAEEGDKRDILRARVASLVLGFDLMAFAIRFLPISQLAINPSFGLLRIPPILQIWCI